MKVLMIALLPVLIFGFVFPLRDKSSVNSGMKSTVSKADGPYVMYKNGHVFAKYIQDNNGVSSVKADSLPLLQKSDLLLTVNTDIPGKTFQVKLKGELKNEKTEYRKVPRQLIISDIEGSFSALRKLLQGNGVIDEHFNWTFGNAHLVLTGDFVDRGDQVTEVLWLIYSLEDKAKAAGGYVHYILGNHEIMNLSGDLRYLHPKYVDNAQLLNEHFQTLYGEQSELGRWLRTKNVAEKIGDILFVHGGISDLVNLMQVTAPEINDLVRPWYADSTYRYPDPRLDTLYSDLGPFWYRGYYVGTRRASMDQIDSTLEKFRVRHIATGHTVIADTISVLYRGKVFNTDVYHAKGISEALLVDHGKNYRVNQAGEKVLLPRK